jgi:hypothetical protein
MKKELIVFITILLVVSACSKRIYEVAYPTLSDGKYDTEFPYKSCSAELAEISKSVRKLNSIAYYKSYVFTPNSEVLKSQILKKDYEDNISKEIFYNNSVIGTATVVSYKYRRIALVTCAHIVDFPDTIFNYIVDKSGVRTPFLQSVAFKERQRNFVADFPERGELEILAMDKKKDIAILGRKFVTDISFPIPVFNYPFGKGEKLEWGSFVYLMGYPKGYLMVTRGIVSQPDRDHEGSFLVDALFNRGFSGGIVLAIKDGVPNFEMVGMARSVSADFEYKLVPPEEVTRHGYDPRIPYDGDVYLEFNRHINYGITFIVSAELIQSFIKDNSDQLNQKGYDLSGLFE